MDGDGRRRRKRVIHHRRQRGKGILGDIYSGLKKGIGAAGNYIINHPELAIGAAKHLMGGGSNLVSRGGKKRRVKKTVVLVGGRKKVTHRRKQRGRGILSDTLGMFGLGHKTGVATATKRNTIAVKLIGM